jgi:hypothetical protein
MRPKDTKAQLKTVEYFYQYTLTTLKRLLVLKNVSFIVELKMFLHQAKLKVSGLISHLRWG